METLPNLFKTVVYGVETKYIKIFLYVFDGFIHRTNYRNCVKVAVKRMDLRKQQRRELLFNEVN